MDPEWVRIQSWHIFKTWTRMPGRSLTLCGRSAGTETASERPGGEKSCETCLRLFAAKAEKG